MYVSTCNTCIYESKNVPTGRGYRHTHMCIHAYMRLFKKLRACGSPQGTTWWPWQSPMRKSPIVTTCVYVVFFIILKLLIDVYVLMYNDRSAPLCQP